MNKETYEALKAVIAYTKKDLEFLGEQDRDEKVVKQVEQVESWIDKEKETLLTFDEFCEKEADAIEEAYDEYLTDTLHKQNDNYTQGFEGTLGFAEYQRAEHDRYIEEWKYKNEVKNG